MNFSFFLIKISQVKLIKKKKSKEVQQLSRSINQTIIECQKKAQQIIFEQIPEQVKQVIKIGQLPYFQKEFEKQLNEKFDKLQDINSPFVKQEIIKDPLIIYPPQEFLIAEQNVRHELQNIQILISEVRQSIEVQQYKGRRTQIQKQSQDQIIGLLEQTQSQLTEVLSLFLQYHESRGDIIYYLQKYQGIDYYILLKLLEIKVQKSLKQFISDFRMLLVLIYDMILENFQTLYQQTQPQNTQQDDTNMYM